MRSPRSTSSTAPEGCRVTFIAFSIQGANQRPAPGTARIAVSTSAVAHLSSHAVSVDPQLRPEIVDPTLDRLILKDRTAPLPAGLARPFMGSVQAHLATQSRDRRGKIEVSDRRVVNQHRVAL